MIDWAFIRQMLPVLEERFWPKVDKTGECWIWTRAQSYDGYGRLHVRINGKHKWLLAHRLAYELVVGPVPAGLVIDHLCRVRACVNPAHMRAVTSRENWFEPKSQVCAAVNSRKTHCKRGHALSGGNLIERIVSRGTLLRVCRECSRDRSRERQRVIRANAKLCDREGVEVQS